MRTDEATAILEANREAIHAIRGVVGTAVGLAGSGAVIQVFVDRDSVAVAVRDHVASLVDVPVEVIVQGAIADAF